MKGYKWVCKQCEKDNEINNSSELFKDFTNRQLMDELHRRGFRGKLTITTTNEVII